MFRSLLFGALAVVAVPFAQPVSAQDNSLIISTPFDPGESVREPSDMYPINATGPYDFKPASPVCPPAASRAATTFLS